MKTLSFNKFTINIQRQSNSIERMRTMRNLKNMPAYSAILRKLENPNLDDGFKNGLIMASKALEKTPMFVDTIEKACMVKYLGGDFMASFIVQANTGTKTLGTSSNNRSGKIKPPSKYDLFNQCLELGLVTLDQWKTCQRSQITNKMLEDMLASNGKLL